MKKQIFFLLFSISLGILSAQDKETFLKGVEFSLEDSNDLVTFASLDSVIKTKKVFFNGEDHTFTKSNIRLELKMMRYLHQKANMRVHLLEFGASVGWLVNKYVQTGDSTYLTALKDYSYKDFKDLFKGLHEYNSKQDSAHRIMVVGIDLEWSFSTSCKVLALLLNDSISPSPAIALSIESIKGLAEYVSTSYNGRSYEGIYRSMYSGTYSMQNTMRKVMEVYYEHKAEFEKCIKSEPETFERIMNGIREWDKWDEFEGKNMIQGTYFREQYMYDRFMEALKKYPNVTFFGQFGRCHIAKEEQSEWCNSYVFNAVASRINNSPDPLVKDKVMTLAIYYPNGHKPYKGSGKFETYNTKEEDEIRKHLDPKKKSNLELFPITGDTLLTRIMGNKFQYLIVNYLTSDKAYDDSDADVPYKNTSYSKIYYHADGFYQFHHVNATKLFEFLSDSGFAITNAPFTEIGGGLTVSEDDYQTVMFHYSSILPIKFSDSIGNSGKLSGYHFMFHYGKDVGPGNWFQAAPYFGMGFGNMKLSITDVNSQAGVFGGTYVEHYNNPAVLLDLGADVRANLGFISLGLRGGWMLDTSDKGWKAGADFVNGAPRTGMTGFYYAANISIFLSE